MTDDNKAPTIFNSINKKKKSHNHDAGGKKREKRVGWREKNQSEGTMVQKMQIFHIIT